MKSLFRREYRIVTDGYAGYEVQHRYPLWPFWMQTGFINTWATLDRAKLFMLDQYAKKVVWKEGDPI